MFRKLIKHEWRATAGTQGLLAAAALGVSVLGGIILRTVTEHGDQLPDLAIIGIVLSLVFMGLAIMGCVIAMSILLLVRFYKNKFTDEGYLTFTLPASSHQIFLSSFVNMLIWSVISGVVLLLSILLFLTIGIYNVDWVDQVFSSELKWILTEITPDPGYIAVFILQCIIGSLYSIVITMTCITVGAVIAKKHKILAAFGIYYGISYLSGIISNMAAIVLNLQGLDALYVSESSIYSATIQSMLVTIVWEVLLIAGGYILSTQLMKKKLNLP